MVEREVFIFIFYFEADVLMLKYNKTYPYLLSLFHSSVQAYYIIHKHIGMHRKHKFSDN